LNYCLVVEQPAAADAHKRRAQTSAKIESPSHDRERAGFGQNERRPTRAFQGSERATDSRETSPRSQCKLVGRTSASVSIIERVCAGRTSMSVLLR
jgi:hypothetical protein